METGLSRRPTARDFPLTSDLRCVCHPNASKIVFYNAFLTNRVQTFMKFSFPSSGLLALIALLCAVTGCSKDDRPEGLPDLQPLTVKVVQAGSPLAGASVRLVPTDASNPWALGGTTDDKGEAAIQTHGKYAGAPLGEYKVTISKVQSDAASTAADDPSGAPAADAFQLVDVAYQSEEKTPTTISVTADEESTKLVDVGAAIKKPLPKL